MRIGIVTFPGSLDDRDAARAVAIAGAEPVMLWHGESDLRGVHAVVLPGGFSYGDYLRCGAISRFAPIMTPIVEQAGDGLPVLGICNGFQILCESHLLPGALTRNASRHFICRDQHLRIEDTTSDWTCAYAPGQQITIPLKNGEGCYVADDRTLDELEGTGRVIARWQHVAVVYNGGTRSSASSFTVYLNGIARATSAASDFSLTTNATSLARNAGFNQHDGLIDDVAVFNRTFTAGEIMQLYTLGRGGMYQRRRRTLRRVAIEQPTGARRRRILTGMV